MSTDGIFAEDRIVELRAYSAGVRLLRSFIGYKYTIDDRWNSIRWSFGDTQQHSLSCSILTCPLYKDNMCIISTLDKDI
jgi:hypothetical protein